MCCAPQNWFDACVETCGGGERDAIEVVTTNAPARGLAAGADGIIYFAMSGGKFAGYLADYEVRSHTRLAKRHSAPSVGAGA
jgi:hypothetical protein